MKISFFKNGYIHLGEDLSYTPPKTEDGVTTPSLGHPDCLFCVDEVFDPSTHEITFDVNTHEYTISILPLPPPKTAGEIKKEIGDTIVREAFEGNPHAQMADLTSGLLGLAYLLVQVVGKDAVNQAIGGLRPSIEAVSDVREQEGLSRYDLSFLD